MRVPRGTQLHFGHANQWPALFHCIPYKCSTWNIGADLPRRQPKRSRRNAWFCGLQGRSGSMTKAEWTRKKRRKTKKERTDPTPDPAGAVTVATRGNVPRGTFSPSERMRRGRSSWALFVIHLKPNWATREGSTWNVRVLVGRRNDQGDRDLDVFHVEHHRWVCLSTSGKFSGMQSHPTFTIRRA